MSRASLSPFPCEWVWSGQETIYCIAGFQGVWLHFQRARVGVCVWLHQVLIISAKKLGKRSAVQLTLDHAFTCT